MKKIISLFLYFTLISPVFSQELPIIPSGISNDSYCARDGSKFGHTVILIDVSSKLDQAQIDYIKGKVFTKNFYLSYPPYTKFSYLLINNNKKPQSQNYIFEKCRPKSGMKTKYGDNDINSDDENAIFVRKYFKRFVKDANQTADSLANFYDSNVPKDKQKSYIYETISAVFDMSKFDFQTGAYSGYKSGTRDLIVISDMMQHTDRLSFYKACNPYILNNKASRCPTYKNLIKKASTRDYVQKTSPKSPSSSIQLYFLTHRNETTVELDTSLERLWRQYLSSVGFKNISFERQLDIQ